jgi:hypothetical protein
MQPDACLDGRPAAAARPDPAMLLRPTRARARHTRAATCAPRGASTRGLTRLVLPICAALPHWVPQWVPPAAAVRALARALSRARAAADDLPPPKAAQAEGAAAAAAAAADARAGVLPADLVALVFERLPPAEQCVTVSRLARRWWRWAASRAEPLAVVLQHREPAWQWRQRAPQLPLWSVAEAWPQLSAEQRTMAGLRAAACGDVERLRWLRAQDPPCPWDWQTCTAAARGGHLGLLRWLRAQDPPSPWNKADCLEAAWEHDDVAVWIEMQASAVGWCCSTHC